MSVFESARFIRLATVLAVALALLLSGVVVGAAGGPLIMGTANSAGTTNTSLTTTSTGTALLVTQTGTGTALRGVANSGIAGFFTSANGSGVSGVVAANSKYGVYGGNDAGTFGGGAAVRASGQQNHGVVATTANAAADALRGINTGGGQALDLVVNAGVAPMSVNSDTKVANLNADRLDGLDESALLRGNILTVTHSVPLSTGSTEVTWFATSIVQPAGHVLTSNVAGNVTATMPATCGGSGYGIVSVYVDGLIVATRIVSGPASSTVTLPLLEPPAGVNFAAPGSEMGRNLEVRISDACGASENVVFNSITLNFVLAG